jgi:hypothetical protein
VTSNDYVHVFKQFTLYRQYLQGDPNGQGPNKTELLLKKAQGSSDLAKLTADVANYTFGSSFTNCLLHLKEKEVFGFVMQLINCPLGANKNSHHPNCVSFFCP